MILERPLATAVGSESLKGFAVCELSLVHLLSMRIGEILDFHGKLKSSLAGRDDSAVHASTLRNASGIKSTSYRSCRGRIIAESAQLCVEENCEKTLPNDLFTEGRL